MFPFLPHPDLLFGPLIGPLDASIRDQVMGLAGQLPVSDRRAKGRSTRGCSDAPLSGAKGCSDLLPAPTGTKVGSGMELLRHIKNAWFQQLWHVPD